MTKHADKEGAAQPVQHAQSDQHLHYLLPRQNRIADIPSLLLAHEAKRTTLSLMWFSCDMNQIEKSIYLCKSEML